LQEGDKPEELEDLTYEKTRRKGNKKRRGSWGSWKGQCQRNPAKSALGKNKKTFKKTAKKTDKRFRGGFNDGMLSES